MTLLDKLIEIDNWNIISNSIPKDVIVKSKSIATVLEGCGFSVFHTGRDSIQFEKTSNGEYLEIEVFSDKIETYHETEEKDCLLNNKIQ